MKNIVILFSLFTFIIASCSKKSLLEDKYVTLSYKQTACADPWRNVAVDSLTLINVADYINASDLYIASLIIKQETQPEACDACGCKTGKIIYVTTFDNDSLKAKYSRIGFK